MLVDYIATLTAKAMGAAAVPGRLGVEDMLYALRNVRRVRGVLFVRLCCMYITFA